MYVYAKFDNICEGIYCKFLYLINIASQHGKRSSQIQFLRSVISDFYSYYDKQHIQYTSEYSTTQRDN